MRILPLLVIVLLIVGALWAPVEIPWQLESIAQVFPRKSWKIAQDGAGNLLVTLTDHRTGETSTTANYQFDRGDLVQAALLGRPDSTALIRRGDTVLAIRTNLIADRLTQLKGQLLQAEAKLSSGLVGEKTPIVLEAENQLKYAEQDFSTQKGLTERQRRLFQEGTISKQELEISENLFEKARIQIRIRQEALESARTGLKPEDVRSLRSSIQSLQMQIDFLERQRMKYAVTAPFDGVCTSTGLPGEAFSMQSTGEHFAKIPIKVEDIRWIGPGAKFELTDAVTGKRWPAKLLGFGTTVEVISGRRAVLAEASIELPLGERFSTGLSGACRIDCGSVNVREYLRRALNWVGQNE